MIGRTLSHYKITAKLGKGGMGEVWQTTDTALNREVAVKVLPAEMAADPERLERFKREAQAIAALNHPNIVTIHSVEEADGVHLLTMELVEGKSLDQMLPPSGFDLERLFPLAIQIADALASAHEKGIVHRDLKPANVMVTDDGRVKVLDFGLAKLAESETEDEATQLMTQAGMILGTVPYMSPEQVQGQEVDSRSDVFSLGILLFEMTTGKRPFGGDNPASVISAILKEQPPSVTGLKLELPNHLGRIVRRCLEKQPQRRYTSAREVHLELDGLEKELAISESVQAASPPGVEEAARESSHKPTSQPWKALTILLGLTTLTLGAAWWVDRGSRSSSDGPPTVLAMELLTDLFGSQAEPSLSPDGKQLLFVAEEGGDLDIFKLRVGGQNAINLTADFPGRDHHPAWSPDGERIAFSSDREGGGVFVMEAGGESRLRVSTEGYHPSWSPDGQRVMVTGEDIVNPYSRFTTGKLTIVDLQSGRSSDVPTDRDAVQGRWSPDGSLIAYWTADRGQRDIRVIASSGTESYVDVTNDLATDWSPVWSPDGDALFFLSDRGGSPDLWRVPVDSATGAPTGPLERVTTGVARVVMASLAGDGRRIAIEAEKTSSFIERIPFDPVNERLLGEPEQVLFSSDWLRQIVLSKDERWLAYRSHAPQEDLYVTRVDGSSRRQLTNDVFRDRGPSWGPGDEWLVFYSNRDGTYQHWMIHPDGTGMRQVAVHPHGLVQPHWSNDGRRIATGFSSGGTPDLSMKGSLYDVDPSWLDPGITPEPITVKPRIEGTPVGWSPDDRYLGGWTSDGDLIQLMAYEVESGEVIRLARADGRPFRASSLSMAWLDGRRLLFWDDEDSMTYVADVETGASRPLPELPGPAEFSVADEGRTLYSLRSAQDSDIWLLTLEDSENSSEP
jgi:serine/threonine protein kinase